jgi:HlyD family secretion protein
VIAIVVAVIIAFGFNYSTRRVVSVRIAKAVRGELISTLSTNGKVQPMRNFAAYSPIAATVEAVYVHAGEKVEAGTPLIALDDSAAKQAVASALAAVRGAQAQLDALRHGGTRQQQIMLAGDIDKARAASEQAAQRLQTLKKLQAQGAASESEVASAEDTLAAEKAALKVLQQQKTSNYTPIDLKHAKANLANAQSAYDAAQDTLKKENVRAPFTGTVYSVLVRPSDFVHAGDKLLQMADLKQVQILAYFDEPEIGQLSDSEAVKIVWEAKPGRVWHGHIIRTPTTIINFGTRNVGEALISVDDADETLLPNTNVTITVTLRDLHNVLIVPREALHSDGTGNYVFELEGSHLKRTPVQIGALNLTQVQIVSGLSEGATIALSAPDGTALHDGLAVKRAR